jgi:hypothetical protein
MELMMNQREAGEERSQLEIFAADLREYVRRAPFATEHRDALRAKLKGQEGEIREIVRRGLGDGAPDLIQRAQAFPGLLAQILLANSPGGDDWQDTSERVFGVLKQAMDPGRKPDGVDLPEPAHPDLPEGRRPRRWAI